MDAAPRKRTLLVGLTVKRLWRVANPRQMVEKIYGDVSAVTDAILFVLSGHSALLGVISISNEAILRVKERLTLKFIRGDDEYFW